MSELGHKPFHLPANEIADDESSNNLETSINPEFLTVDQAARLIYFSFYFSQGKPRLQHGILRWLHLSYPEYNCDNIDQEQLVDVVLKSIKKTVPEKGTGPSNSNATHIGVETDISLELLRYTNLFFDYLRGEGALNILGLSELRSTIATQMINQDYHWLISKSGRPRHKQGERKGPMHDPFLSHICYYALQGKSTGVPEYDQLMKEVATVIRQEFSQNNMLLAVIDRYNRLHQASVSVH